MTVTLPPPTFALAARIGPRSYVWGYIQGALFILLGFGLISKVHTIPAQADCVLAIILGFSILRRNRLIIPLLCLHFAVNLFYVTWFYPPGRVPPLLPFLLGIVYFIYYMNRKDEFVGWI